MGERRKSGDNAFLDAVDRRVLGPHPAGRAAEAGLGVGHPAPEEGRYTVLKDTGGTAALEIDEEYRLLRPSASSHLPREWPRLRAQFSSGRKRLRTGPKGPAKRIFNRIGHRKGNDSSSRRDRRWNHSFLKNERAIGLRWISEAHARPLPNMRGVTLYPPGHFHSPLLDIKGLQQDLTDPDFDAPRGGSMST